MLGSVWHRSGASLAKAPLPTAAWEAGIQAHAPRDHQLPLLLQIKKFLTNSIWSWVSDSSPTGAILSVFDEAI